MAMSNEGDTRADVYVATMRRVLRGTGKSFIVFERGTVVVVVGAEPDVDLAARAVALLSEWGPVHVGTPAGDFNVITLPDGLGWAVTCHHPDIITLVALGEAPGGALDLLVGLLGRSKRAEDAERLSVVHVEDAREP
jgi:hypothetical protein